MAKTVQTSAASLLTVAEFLKRADLRTVGDLCSDTGTRITSGGLATDTHLAAALLDATGIVEQACLVAKRYLPADLAALTGAGLGSLYRLLSRLTLCLLFERRPDLEMKQPWIWEWVEEQLEKLRQGERIFPFTETEDAGLIHIEVETAPEVEARNGISYIMQRMWGRRGNRRGPWVE